MSELSSLAVFSGLLQHTAKLIRVVSSPCAAERLAILNNELVRLGKLPANSPYAQHRIAIARKCIELLTKPRAAGEADELEKLLASLSL